jgi:hypothetical protein
MSGYGVPVGLGELPTGAQCPQCGESDLQPCGNGSKWACPRYYFIAVLRRRRARGAALGQHGTGSIDGGPWTAVLKVGPSPGGPGYRLGPRIGTSLAAQVSQRSCGATRHGLALWRTRMPVAG